MKKLLCSCHLTDFVLQSKPDMKQTDFQGSFPMNNMSHAPFVMSFPTDNLGKLPLSSLIPMGTLEKVKN